MTEDGLNRRKVLLGMSGGVDSTTAALLLQEAGYQVAACYFDVFKNPIQGEWSLAKKAAEELGIEISYVNVHEAFEQAVICPFCQEYSQGRTPNPCISCNPSIKFPTLIEEADRIGAYYIATGHYARSIYSPELKRWLIAKGRNPEKDQTYMLYRLPENILKRLLMPLGDVKTKDQVRDLAEQAQLSSASLKDSQGICFLKSGQDYHLYLKERGYGEEPGYFVDTEGKILGKHRGIIHYTLGQRKGLGMSFGRPMYVVAIDSIKNQVVLGKNDDLFSKELLIDKLVGNPLDLPDSFKADLTAKTRYVIKEASCSLEASEEAGQLRVAFDEAQRALTPGQSIVLYSKGMLVGGGIVKSVNL